MDETCANRDLTVANEACEPFALPKYGVKSHVL